MGRWTSRVYAILFVILFYTHAAKADDGVSLEQKCYTPLGIDRNTLADAKAVPSNTTLPAYRACPAPNGGHSMCCRTAVTDVCLANGLCLDPKLGSTWRESCTDPTWKDPACLKLFVDGLNPVGKANNGTDQQVVLCDDGSFCQGLNGDESCCNTRLRNLWIISKSDGYAITDTKPVSTPSSSSTTTQQPSTSTTATAAVVSVSSTTSAETANRTAEPQQSGTSHTAIIVASVLGSLLFVSICLGVGAYCYLRQRRQAREAPANVGAKSISSGNDSVISSPSIASPVYGRSPVQQAEMQGQQYGYYQELSSKDRYGLDPNRILEMPATEKSLPFPPQELDCH